MPHVKHPRSPRRYEKTFGSGAGFYLDATEAPWSANYRMFSYISQELPAVVAAHFPLRMDRQGIFGHSMGGHGALLMALRHSDRFRSCSAFAPITSPSQADMPAAAFARYLGPDRDGWRAYDSVALIEDEAPSAPSVSSVSDSGGAISRPSL